MHCHAKHLLLPRPLPPWKPLTATLKPFKTHITATQNTYYCHTLCHTRNLLETFYCHAKHLLLPRPLPPCKPLLPRQNLSKHISLPRPYHTRKPLLPHHCHTTATPLPHHCHTAATQLPHHTTATGCLNMWFQFQYIGGFLRLKSNSLNKKSSS